MQVATIRTHAAGVMPPVNRPRAELATRATGLLEQGLGHAAEAGELVRRDVLLDKSEHQALDRATLLAKRHDKLAGVRHVLPYAGLASGCLMAATASLCPAAAVAAGVATLGIFVADRIMPGKVKQARKTFDAALAHYRDLQQQHKSLGARMDIVMGQMDDDFAQLAPYAKALTIKKEARQQVARIASALEQLKAARMELGQDQLTLGDISLPVEQ